MKRISIVLSLVLLAVLVGSTAFAAELMAPPSKQYANLTLSSSEQHRNLYVAAGNLTVNSTILGDLYAAGGMVNVTGIVEQDLVVAGGNLNVSGPVGDDARIAGGNITVNSVISGDLLVAGGNVSISEKASVGGDLVVAGGNISIDSPVAGNLKVTGGDITINSRVGGDVTVRAGKQVIFGSKAEIAGKITYTGPKEAIVDLGAKVGTIEFTKIEAKDFRHGLKGLLVLATLLKLLGLLVAGFVINYFFPRKVRTVVEEAMDRPLNNLGRGFVALIVPPVLAVILLISVVGMYLGLIILFAYLLAIIFSSILMLFYVGNLVYSWYKRGASLSHNRSLILGTVIVMILGLIPFLGWLVLLFPMLITLGSMTNMLRKENF